MKVQDIHGIPNIYFVPANTRLPIVDVSSFKARKSLTKVADYFPTLIDKNNRMRNFVLQVRAGDSK